MDQHWGFTTPAEPAFEGLLKRIALLTAINPARLGIDRDHPDRPVEQALGCGLIVRPLFDRSTGKPYLVVCTAAHVLDEAESRLTDGIAFYGGFSPPPKGTLLERELRNRTLHVVVARDDIGAEALPVVAVSFYREADLAYVIAEGKTPHPAPGQPLMLIDSDPLPVNAEVVVLGAPEAKIEIKAWRGGIRSKVEVSWGWQARNGRISNLLPGVRLVTTPVYETTVQAPPRMSGGPVLLLEPGDRFRRRGSVANVAVGILSHEFSDVPPGSPPNVHREGHSYVIPAASLYGLLTRRPFFNSEGESIVPASIVDHGLRSKEIQVSVRDGVASVRRGAQPIIDWEHRGRDA